MPRIPPVGVKFKPGNNMNPRGAGAHNQSLKKLRKLTRDEIEGVYGLLRKKSYNELKAMYESGDMKFPANVIIANVLHCIKKGDSAAMERIFKELAGPQKQEIEHSGSIAGGNTHTVLILPDNGRDKPAVEIDEIIPENNNDVE